MTAKILWAAPLAALAISAAAPQIAGARSPAQPQGDAAKPAKTARSCFWAQNANNFAAADDRTVNVRVGVREVYQFELFGTCPEIDWTQGIALVSRGTSSICSGMDAEIVVPSAIGPQRCAVRNVRKLTEAEVAALPPKAKP